MMLEQRDLLGDTVIEHRKIVLAQRADDTARGVFHAGQQTDQAHVDPEHILLGDCARTKDQRETNQKSDASKRSATDHLGRTDSSHSPSTQTSPPAKCSLFQIGARRLSRLMPSRAASKAGRRCGAVTTTATLVSPISMRPSRCTIAMRPIGWDWAISRPISAR